MEQYHSLCERILAEGVRRDDRTGTGTLSVFGHQMRFDLSEGFPLMTTKDMGGVRLDGIIEELLWFLRGDTNIKSLVNKGVNIWNRDAFAYFKRNNPDSDMTYKEYVDIMKNPNQGDKTYYYSQSKMGDLGRVYGAQWRSYSDYKWNGAEMVEQEKGIDQIANVIESLRNDPNGRRHIVSAWNPAEIEDMALPPCHVLFQFYVANGKLSCQLYQRSGDVFLGVPYNIASYSLLTTMIAQVVGLQPGEFVHTLGDAHIYLNHIDQVEEQLSRDIRPLPKMEMNPFVTSIDGFTREDFELEGYDPHPSIKGAQSF